MSADQQAPVVECQYGRVAGLNVEGVHEFRGIPFARPPVGELRFQPPQKPSRWSGILQADRFPMAALQEKNPLMGINQVSDDCLYLNIWRPDHQDGPLPVMVWIHGGGYQTGSPSQRMYSGRELARRQNVIVVNLSYRLGFWGFGWFDGVAPELEAASNLGIRDQIAGLQWVRENIAEFGGDPEAVTLFGESAGGFSIGTLMSIPEVSTLYHRAIIQSGSGDFVMDTEQANRVAESVVSLLPGTGNIADRLLQATPDDLVRAQRAVYRLTVDRGLRTTTPQYAMTTMPVIDGELLTQVPYQAIAAGSAEGKEVIAGVCRDEWNLFLYAPPFNGNHSLDKLRQQPVSEAQRRFQRALPEHADEAWELYRGAVSIDERRGPLDLFSAMESDRLFRIPTLRLLDSLVAGGGKAWGYEFTWEIEAFGIPLGACHVSDIPFTFGGLDSPVGQLFSGGGGQVAQQLVDRVQHSWADFARGHGAEWPNWQQGRSVVEFGPDPGAPQRRLFSPEREAFWEQVIAPPVTG